MRRQEHRERLRRHLAVIHGSVLGGLALVVVATGLVTVDGQRLPHLLLGAGLVVLGLLTAFRGERAQHLLLSLPLAVAGALPAFAEAGDVSGPMTLTASFLNAVRTLPTARSVGVVAAASAAFFTVRIGSGVEVDAYLLGSYLLGVANTFVAGAFVASLERSADAMDEASAAAHAGSMRLAAQQARERAVEDARRVLHDEVLTALRAVADAPSPSVTTQADREGKVRALCRDAVAAVDEAERATESDEETWFDAGPRERRRSRAVPDVERWIKNVRRASPIDVRVALELDGVDWDLEPPVERAATRAVLEALRNAQRHGGVDRAELRIARDADRLLVIVRDDGRGFGADASEGVGITESIRGPVSAVGGAVRLSRPGVAGAWVELSLPLRPRDFDLLRRTYDLTLRAGAERRLMPDTMAPLVLVWVVIATAHAVMSDDPAPQLLLVVAAIGMSVLVTHRLQHAAPTRRWLMGVAAALLGLQALGLAMQPPGAMLDLRPWSIGTLAAPLLVLGFVLPARWSLALIAAHVVVVASAPVLDPGLSGGTVPSAAINAVVGIPLLTVALGVGLRRNAVVIERGRAAALASAAEVIHRRYASEVSSLHLDHTRRVVVPWLRDVAEGRVDVASDDVRRTARLMMLEARDDLHAPGFHSADQRAATTAFRAAGGVVDIRPGFAPGAHERLSGRLLRDLVDRLPGRHRVTVSPPGVARRAARVVVLPPPPEGLVGELADDPRLRVRGDELALEVEFEDR